MSRPWGTEPGGEPSGRDYHGVEAHKNKKGAKATEKLTHGEDPWLPAVL